MGKCRHKKGVILASANMIHFYPDQEPFKSGVLEKSGFESIVLESINIHYCPNCNTVEIETTGDVYANTE